ncbi:hypothetical protein QLX08_008602 [Tetragonisca angustula]|uniref:Uncharacterized protein n=1 Tax=Tetragonisca angustula TaxID=166442 RepID=A0AAW0ZK84_9HYME
MPCLRSFFVEEYSVGGTAAAQQGAQGRRWSIADNFYSESNESIASNSPLLDARRYTPPKVEGSSARMY